MRRTTQSDSMNDSSLLRSIRSDARSLARHIATRSRARRVRTSRTTRTNFTNRELHGLHRRTSRVIRRLHDRSLTVVGKTNRARGRSREDASRAAMSPTETPPRWTTFLRFAFRADASAIDIDGLRRDRARAYGNHVDRAEARARGGRDARGTPSARVASLACADFGSPVDEFSKETYGDILTSARAFALATHDALGNDTMSERELGDACEVAYASAEGKANEVLRARMTHREIISYERDEELARKACEAIERGLMREVVSAVNAALGTTSGERAAKELVELIARAREYEGEGVRRMKSKASENLDGRGKSFRAKTFGDGIKLKRAGDDDGGRGRATDLKRVMRENLAQIDERERAQREREKLVHPDERLGSTSSSLGALPHIESDATTQLTWLKTECERFSASGAHALDESWDTVASAVGRVVLNTVTSDESCAAELYEYLGDSGFELIAGIVERRAALARAIKTRARMLRDTLAPPSASDGPGASISRVVTITSTLDKQLEKARRKEERKANRKLASGTGDDVMEWLQSVGIGFDALCEGDWENQKNLSVVNDFEDILAGLRGLGRGLDGGRKALPAGTTRIVHDEGYEEIHVPAREPDPIAPGELSVAVEELDEWAQPAFAGITKLNRIQSRIFPQAYHTNENLLVCAPTGAGKTNIAMLTVLHEIGKHIDERGEYLPEDFKIVYVAPMKALAAEVTSAFSRRLAPLDIVVAELTGDTQMSKRELEETQMIVTTPEKWDVITRKGGEVSISSTLRLLIIDEVHLLNDERGPVIETLVARTLRQVEQTQSMIRIVGLSATLPNPVDVARFLGVNQNLGLFVFDQSYRPIPLTQKFIGVTEKNALKRQTLMTQIAYNKCCEALRKGKQAMVFVHSRKDTVKTAKQLAEFAAAQGGMELFSNDMHDRKAEFSQQVMRSRNNELKDLFLKGLGCHNAGMLRADRTLTEKLFAAGVVKVLVCTATLAWGVNLPAHMVVIKGTQLYDPQRGGFRNLGVLDVQQIFGRAGRPGLDTSGEGVIVTEHKNLAHYVSMLTHSTPIESQFVSNLADNLNAEVTLGTVTNIREGAQWLGYTYLHTRMEQNPLSYGLTWDDVRLDPGLLDHRRKLIREAARTLDKAKMIRFDERSGQLYQTEGGRTASHFYIRVKSMEVFDGLMQRHMTMPEILHMISHSSEFENIVPREDEIPELETLRRNRNVVPIEIKGSLTDKVGKVNLLLQVYISRANMQSFSLIADSMYISQNVSRICRALFELCLRRGWPSLAEQLLTMSKACDLRIWPHQHELRQFEKTLKPETLFKLEEKKATLDRLWDMSAGEIGSLLKLNAQIGGQIKQCMRAMPHLNMMAVVQPITRSVLRVSVTLIPEFEWRETIHGTLQRWLIWVEDPVNEHIYHHETFNLSKKQCNDGAQYLAFTIPIFEPVPPQYFLRAMSETWLGCESFVELNFQHLILPDEHPPNTELLDLDPLPRSALNNPAYESMYKNKFTHFNAIQTQAFHTLYHTDTNVLLGAPTGSGKTISAELAMMKVFRDSPGSKVVYIAPLKALVRERIKDWRQNLCPTLGLRMVELTGDYTPDLRALLQADIIVSTPEKWDGISRNWQSRAYVTKVALVVIDEIHLLASDRGPILEVIVSRMRYISARTGAKVRIVGLSTALANAHDLGDWLGIEKEGLFNFRPSVRPVPLECHIQGFPGKFYCPRMMTMNKPTYAAIRTHSPDKPALVFVSSRRQTRLTALDLIAYAAADERPDGFVNMSDDEMAMCLSKVKDPALKHTLQFGIGLHHAGLAPDDREMCEELFSQCKIQVLVTTSTLAWGVNLPAHLVVIKGTEYFDGKTKRYQDFPITDVLQMMGRAGRPQFDKSGCCVILVHEPKKTFYKKFLYEPFPVESSLADKLCDHFNAEIVSGTIKTKQDAVDYLTWTYFFRRLLKNPTYYNLDTVESDNLNAFLSDLVENALELLEDARCIAINEEDNSVEPLMLGRVASYYYLQYPSVALFAANIKHDSSLESLLQTLCGVAEYDELPVRHNEDKLNVELARVVADAGGFAVDARLAEDPHVKASLLFQCHFLQLALPVSDYYTDTKSVLDQAIRILQAMIDVTSDAGWLRTALSTMNLMQMIMQGRMLTDSSLLMLPHITHDHVKKLKDRGITGLPQLIEMCAGDKQRAHKALADCGISSRNFEQIVALCARLPSIKVKAFVDKTNGSDGRTIHVKLYREGKSYGPKAPTAHTPRFPKIKEEGWWIIVGDVANDELLALRRVSFGARAHIKLSCPKGTSNGGRSPKLAVFFVSDAYIGLDQEIEINADDVYDGLDSDDEDADTFWILPPKETEPFWLGEV